MLVGRVRSLRDQAFPTLAARVSEESFSALVPMLGEPQGIAEREQSPQDLLPVPLRHGGGVVPVRVEDVEQVEGDGPPGATSPPRIRDLHPPLQPGEARPVPLERHDLAVDHEVLGLLRGEGLDELGVVGVHLLAVAGQQPDRAPAPERQAPLPVELALEDPVGIGEGPVVRVASIGCVHSGCRARRRAFRASCGSASRTTLIPCWGGLGSAFPTPRTRAVSSPGCAERRRPRPSSSRGAIAHVSRCPCG